VLLADELFLLAHDDVSGTPRLHLPTVRLGLAAALIGELLLAGRITTYAAQVLVTDRTPPHDALAHAVLDQLAAEPQHLPLRTWLTFLAEDTHQPVALRLWRAGHLRQEPARRLLRRGVRYVPVDMNAAAWPWARLTGQLSGRESMATQDLLLAGRVLATGLDRMVLRDTPATARHTLDQRLAALPVPLRELLGHTAAAVGESVLTQRR